MSPAGRRARQLADGRTIDADLVRTELEAALATLRTELEGTPAAEHLDAAAGVFLRVALEDPFIEFLTLPAYGLIN